MATDHRILVLDNEFKPKSLTIDVGDTVVWEWQGTNHSVTSDDNSWPQEGPKSSGEFRPPVLNPAQTPGTYDYYCVVHGGAGGQGMSGKVTVRERKK